MPVRRGSGEDWRALRAIRLEALRDTPEAYGETYESAAEFSDDQWREAATTWSYFIAERDGDVVGMVSGGEHDKYPGTLWMYSLYVTPSARGRGVADQLVDAVTAWARDGGVSELYLHVTMRAQRAKAFYTRIGFEATGEHFEMSRDPSIELVTMVRSLVDA